MCGLVDVAGLSGSSTGVCVASSVRGGGLLVLVTRVGEELLVVSRLVVQVGGLRAIVGVGGAIGVGVVGGGLVVGGPGVLGGVVRMGLASVRVARCRLCWVAVVRQTARHRICILEGIREEFMQSGIREGGAGHRRGGGGRGGASFSYLWLVPAPTDSASSSSALSETKQYTLSTQPHYT